LGVIKVTFLNRRLFVYYKIIDGMKKESKTLRNIMIFGYILVALTFVYMFVNSKNFFDKEIITMFLAYFVFGTIGLYCWIYAFKYRVEFDDKTILLKTLFRKAEINLCDIEKYTCTRYKKSVFYQFDLFTKDKKVLVNTRYKVELETILRENKIEQIIK
jgi:hypothetical protein